MIADATPAHGLFYNVYLVPEGGIRAAQLCLDENEYRAFVAASVPIPTIAPMTATSSDKAHSP